MSRVLYAAEIGYEIHAENGDVVVAFIGGAAAPGGDTSYQDAAPIGSLYARTDGSFYQKTANAGATSDWVLNGSSNAVVGKWRQEKVSVVTNEGIALGVRDMVASPFTDDDGTPLPIGTFVVGEYVIGAAGASSALYEITDVTGNNVTYAFAANPLVAEDTFITNNYLPDPDGGENKALVNYNGTAIVKLSDIDWNFADGINMALAYAAAPGTITSADTVNSAIEKLDGNQQALTASIAELSQDIGPQNVPQNTPVTVGNYLVDDCQAVEYEVTAHDIGDPTKVKTIKVTGVHNGHAGADATDVKDSVHTIIKLGGNFNLKASIVLGDAGVAQTIGLLIDTTDADGIRFSARATCVKAL